MIHITLTPNTVHSITNGQVVLVNNPATNQMVEVVCAFVSEDIVSEMIYFTTTSSKVDEYHRLTAPMDEEGNYGVADALYDQYIFHIRTQPGGSAVMTRSEFAQLLEAGTYVIG